MVYLPMVVALTFVFYVGAVGEVAHASELVEATLTAVVAAGRDLDVLRSLFLKAVKVVD